jgi:hypothetical protein
MTTEQVIAAIREAVGQHEGDEMELLEELEAEYEGWQMRLQELDAEAGFEGVEDDAEKE